MHGKFSEPQLATLKDYGFVRVAGGGMAADGYVFEKIGSAYILHYGSRLLLKTSSWKEALGRYEDLHR